MSKTRPIREALRFLLVLVGALVTLYPLWWMLVSSFTPELEIFRQSGLWPADFTVANYVAGWRAGVAGSSFGAYIVNSFSIVVPCVVGMLISSSMAAYAFARMEFDLKGLFFSIMFLTMMLPFHVTLIPRFIIFHRLGWVNTIRPLVLPSFLAIDGFFIFLIVQFMRGLPIELEQAALVDGCGPIQTFLCIILPLSKPALVSAAVFSFIWTWNDFMSPLIYLNNPALYPVSLALRAFQDATSDSAVGPMFAMSIISLVPVLVLFVLAQRLLIEGIRM